MGEVYLAEDTELDRKVALKVLPAEMADDPDRLERFKREAKAVAALNHPNIVTLHSVEEHDGVHFIVMEHVEGSTLDQLIGPDGMSVERFFEVGGAVAEALRAAHDQGIVHRDLKPTNIMVTNDGLVKVLDFGLAKLQKDAAVTSDEDSATELMTRQGEILGTTPYMSPEQASARPVDHRSDIFSFGIVLYQMASGDRPFQGGSPLETISSILKDAPTPLGERRADLPSHLARIVHRCLEKEPADRYQSSRELSAELQRPQDDDAVGRYLVGDRSASRRWVPVVATVALIGFLVVALFTLFDREQATDVSNEVTRLAVLPFSNLRSDPETDFLGYALADQIIGSLVYVQDLTVRPSSSVRQYQHGEYDLDEVGDELAVNFVLAGNYLQQGDRMRLTVELIDLESEQTVWREPIEVPYQDAFEMQDLVSERLLARLEVSFSDDERDRMKANVSQNPLAYEYYLRALSYPEEAEGNRLAVNMLRQSIELDSTFAPAWDALGRRAQLMAYWELGGEEVMNQAKDSFLKALELNPELFSALAHLTMLYTDAGETDLAMKNAQRALEINPNSAVAVFAYGYVLRYAGMIEESITAMDTALEIDPTNPMFRSAAFAYVQNDRYDDAIETFYLGSLDLAVAWEGEIAIRRGELQKARAKLSQAAAADPEGITGLWAIGVLSALDGDYEQGIEAARKWEEADLFDGEGWFFLAGIYCLNQEIDKCISVLDTAVDRGAFEYPHWLKCRFLDPAREDPDLNVVLEKARLKHEAFKEKFFGAGST